MLAADPSARRHLAATSRWSRRLRWQTARPPWAGRVRSSGEAGLLTVAGWSSPGQLAALRERLSAWPMSLNGTAARLILAVGPEHDVVILQTHHAAFDGISSLALLSAICAAYRDAVGAGIGPQTASPSRARPLDPAPAGRARDQSWPGPAPRGPARRPPARPARCCPAW